MSLEARENMPHVNDGLLHEYLDGELTGAARDDLLSHLAECAICRTRLEEERALAARASELLARSAPIERAPASFASLARSRAPRWQIPAAWAATILIAFGIGRYTQGGKLQHDVAGPATRPELGAPLSSSEKAPRRVLERSRIEPSRLPPSAAGLRREDAAGKVAAPVAAPFAVAEAAAPRDEADAWQELDADAARRLLGRAPAVLPGHPVRRMARSPTNDGVVLIEQEWRPGIVLRLYERRALTAGRVAEADRLSSQRARSAPSVAARAEPALRGENLARYISSLRVEIAGPLAADSLAQLLDSVE
jgi:anti-sigma factor RsiW